MSATLIYSNYESVVSDMFSKYVSSFQVTSTT